MAAANIEVRRAQAKAMLPEECVPAAVKAMARHGASTPHAAAGPLPLPTITFPPLPSAALNGCLTPPPAAPRAVPCEGVQFAFLGVLWSGSSTLDRAKRAAALGAERAVAAALAAHPRSERLQEAGLAALANLTAAAEGQVKAAACGAIELVVAGMASFPLNAHLQEAGCSCLRNFSADPAAQAQVATEHAIRARCGPTPRLDTMRHWCSAVWEQGPRAVRW